MLPNLTNQYISYSMALFSANEIRTFLKSCWFKRLLLEQFRKLFKYDGVKKRRFSAFLYFSDA